MGIFSILWRLWFYIAVFIAIVVLFPFIWVTAQTDTRYRAFFNYSRIWAKMVLYLSGFIYRCDWEQRPNKDQPYIICPNHTSMIDIMLTLALFDNCFVFIGKKELASLPLFGYFCRKTNLLVDRRSLSSRKAVMDKARRKLEEDIGLCVFPEGGVPEDSDETLARFKNGAFVLAAEYNLPVIPVSYPDNKKHFPFNWWKGYPGFLRAHVHSFILPRENTKAEVDRMREECYQTILQTLQTKQNESKLAILKN